MIPRPPRSTLFTYPTLFRSEAKSKEWGRIAGEVATGSVDFSLRLGADTQTEVYATALVRARVSVSGMDDLVVVDRANHQLHIVSNVVQSTDFSRAVTVPRAVAIGPSDNPQSATRNPQSNDPVATAR